MLIISGMAGSSLNNEQFCLGQLMSTKQFEKYPFDGLDQKRFDPDAVHQYCLRCEVSCDKLKPVLFTNPLPHPSPIKIIGAILQKRSAVE